MNIAILILAAGASTRMGRTKQLLPWKNTTLLGNAITTAKTTIASDVFVVLGAKADMIQKENQQDGIVFIENTNWNLGLGSSIACGVQSIIKTTTSYNGLLLMLADQPYMDASYLNQMIMVFMRKEKGIITTNYGNKQGVPAIFALKYYRELAKLNADYGAKEIIKQYMTDSVSLDPDGREMDIDTMEVYQKSLKKLKNSK